MTNITLYQNDFGHVINFTISGNGQTTTGATLTRADVTKPDGTSTTWAAIVYDVNTLTYQTLAGDLASVGTYVVKPYMTKAATPAGMHGAPLYILVQ